MSDPTVKQFFDLLDRYLMGDLETMVCEIRARTYGGLGYPAMQTMLSAMELLGLVISGGKRDQHAFYYFWDNYLAVGNPGYNADPRLKKIFRNAIRNGIAHHFLAKFGIQLSKEDTGHLTRTETGELNIDVSTFCKDFKKVYSTVKNQLQAAQPNSNAIRGFKRGHRCLLRDMKAARTDIAQYVEDLPATPKELPVNTDSPVAGLVATRTTSESFSSHPTQPTRIPNDEWH